MEIIRGNLEDISRPASSEQTGSRVSSVQLHGDRVSPSTPFELIVLTNDSADLQRQRRSTESTTGSGKDQSQIEVSGDENEDSELQKAFEEMTRLDEILSAETSKEKEIHCQRKKLQAKLWQELLKETEGHSECAFEALNTKLFLSLEAHTGAAEENFVPVFETQVPDCELHGDKHSLEQRDKKPGSLTESFDVTSDGAEDGQLKASSCKSLNSKSEQKDFIRRNIEFVSGDVGQVCLTLTEKERLAELLRDINEEEEGSVKGTDSETASVSTGQGYTPEPSDLEQLIEIDSKIRRLLPVEELNSLQSSYTNLSMSQCLDSRFGWKSDKVRRPGEKVLQDIKERREQETRLQEIQEQLEILGLSQEKTEMATVREESQNESPDLTEEQLLRLLDECELMESWSLDYQRNEATSRDS